MQHLGKLTIYFLIFSLKKLGLPGPPKHKIFRMFPVYSHSSLIINNSFIINSIDFKIKSFIFSYFSCRLYFTCQVNLKSMQKKNKNNRNVIMVIIKDYSECLLMRLKFMRLKMSDICAGLDHVFLLMCKEISFQHGRPKT